MFQSVVARLSGSFFFNTPDRVGGGGPVGPAPAGGGAPSAPPVAAPPSADPGAGGGTPAGGSGTPPRSFSYGEDRSDWIPPYRYQPLRQEAESAAAIRRENEILTGRVRALAGLEPAADPRAEQVKGAFFEMFPELRGLIENKDQLAQVLEFVKSGGIESVGSMREAFYGRHAHDIARTATERWADLVGKKLKDLPDGTFEAIASNLQVFLQQDPSGQRYQRFQYGDTGVMEEFIGRMRSLFVDPIRTTQAVAAATAVETNRGLPAQGPAGAPAGSGEPPKKLRGKELSQAARNYMLGNKATV